MSANTPWDRLVAAARKAPDQGDADAPYGFSVRVAALAMSAERARLPVFGQLSVRSSLRALGVASLLALVTVGAGYPSLVKVLSTQPVPAPAVPVAVQPSAAEAGPEPAPQETASPGAVPSDDPVSDVLDLLS